MLGLLNIVVALGVLSGATDQAPAPLFDLMVETEMHFSNRRGGRSSGSWLPLVVGTPIRRITDSGPGNCGFNAGDLRRLNPDAAVGWQVDATPVTITAGHAVVHIRWSREIERGKRTGSVPQETSVLLRPGDALRLDTVVMPTQEASCQNPVATLVVSLIAREPERQRVVSTDLWLVHRGADGKESAFHQNVRGRFYEQARFSFAGVKVGNFDLDVFGSLTPQPRSDGSIALELSTSRDVFSAGRSLLDSPNQAYFGQGVAALVFKPDDVVAIEIPMKPWASSSGDVFTLRVRTKQIR